MRQSIVTREQIRVMLLFTAIVVLILAVLWPTTRSMVQQWQQSATYGHCYLVVPIAMAMAWRQSAALVAAPVSPFWPGFALIEVTAQR